MNDTRALFFNCREATQIDTPPQFVIDTPLGGVRVDAILSGVRISTIQPTSNWAFSNGAQIWCWHNESFKLEMLLCRPSLRPQDTNQCDECWAVLWRLEDRLGGIQATFEGGWEPEHRWNQGAPDSAQRLMASVWEGDHCDVSIGTEDAEWLERRASQKRWLPQRWADAINPYAFSSQPDARTGTYDPVEVFDHGYSTRFQSLIRGERCQSHFIAAWAKKSDMVGALDVDRRNPRYSIDIDAEDILAGAECS